MTRTEIFEALKEQKKAHATLAKRKLSHFSTYIDPSLDIEWFHKIIYDVLDDWIEGKKPKVAIFVPPQHGKSQMSSIITPTKVLGMKPKSNVVVASFSDSLVKKFNRKCQDYIDSKGFRELYPGVILPAKGIESTNELRNTGFFEIIKHKGNLKSVTIKGSLTGDPIDFGIIDDPIKDRKQANSETYRDGIWDWYVDVFKKRLHNKSRQLLLFTRWNEDDIAGRLFNPKNKHFDQEEADEWVVLVFQALKEPKLPMEQFAMKYEDPREIDGALWPEKHSAEKHKRTRRLNPVSFASLDQQRPSPAEGNKIKRSWFEYVNENELPFNPDTHPKEFMIDGAFTDKTENDESAQMAYTIYKGKMYIFNCHGVRKELPEYLKYIVPWLKSSGYKGTSTINIEMKASGYAFYSMLKTPEYGNHNCVKVNTKHVALGKVTRVDASQPTLASGKVVLVRGSWNSEFVDQCAGFPNVIHDDMVDCLCYGIHKHFIGDTDVEVSYS